MSWEEAGVARPSPYLVVAGGFQRDVIARDVRLAAVGEKTDEGGVGAR